MSHILRFKWLVSATCSRSCWLAHLAATAICSKPVCCNVQWLLVERNGLSMCRSLLIWINSALLTGLEMFPVSSQKKYWTFGDETDLIRLRNEANRKFILKHGANMTVGVRHIATHRPLSPVVTFPVTKWYLLLEDTLALIQLITFRVLINSYFYA